MNPRIFVGSLILDQAPFYFQIALINSLCKFLIDYEDLFFLVSIKFKLSQTIYIQSQLSPQMLPH